ncbi:MAG TPA: TlpA disulfide reductase family protein, partial [Candidatus Polarisedimenticolia bacterium]|nr:TlpA disulfide reductase family protein [Candidatus Polarisedimenticolia bacterium]
MDRFAGRVSLVVENWGDSAIAKRLGVTRYPVVFVDEAVFAGPADMGFYGDRKSGRYTPWRDPANHTRFKADLTWMLERVLEGDRPPAAPTGAGADRGLQQLPEFRLADLQGRPLAASELRGKPLLVEFWATWCHPCRKTLPWLASLKRSHPGQLEILGIAVESEEGEVREFASTLPQEIRMAMGTPELAAAFGDLVAVPTLFLFDGEGKLSEVFYGAPDDLHDRIGRAVSNLLLTGGPE